MTDYASVLDHIDDHRDDLRRFVLEFANTWSPQGYEQEASRFMYDWMADAGFEAELQPVVGTRENAVGRLRGRDDLAGDDLLFNGHLDTAYGRPEDDEWTISDRSRVYTESWADGDLLIGDDVVNDKGPIASFLFAALALKEVGVPLGGDLYLTGVVGEIGRATVDEYRDPDYLGNGIGAHRLVTGGYSADYALVAECTDYAIARMECGVAWFKVEIPGAITYQPLLALTDPDTVEEEHTGSLLKAARATIELERWACEYTAENTREYDHGTMQPTAGVGAIRSGNPDQPATSPGKAALYLDVLLPPGKTPQYVKDDVEAVLAGHDIDAEVSCYWYHQGHVIDEVAGRPLIESLERSHDAIRHEPTPRPKPHFTSMWRDSNVFNENGIPSVNFGPPRSTESEEVATTARHNALHVDDIVTTAKIFALTAIDVCGDEGTGHPPSDA